MLCTRAKRFGNKKKINRVDRTRPRAKGQGSRLVPRRTCADRLTTILCIHMHCNVWTRTAGGVCEGPYRETERKTWNLLLPDRHVVARNFIISLLACALYLRTFVRVELMTTDAHARTGDTLHGDDDICHRDHKTLATKQIRNYSGGHV